LDRKLSCGGQEKLVVFEARVSTVEPLSLLVFLGLIVVSGWRLTSVTNQPNHCCQQIEPHPHKHPNLTRFINPRKKETRRHGARISCPISSIGIVTSAPLR
jgi:hypothetical protein